ncbi:MAG: tail fiber protein [Oceanicaulis sp.]|nr:tail fiber protein [Oceanicaulis sp.]
MKLMTTLATGMAASALLSTAASAQIDQYIGDVMLVGFNFCPPDWVEANGDLLPISQYQALFALIGTTYGGDGQNTVGVPDLRGRIPVGAGAGSGLAPVVSGETLGTESVTLTSANLAQHTHAVLGTSQIADVVNPENATPASFNQPRYHAGGVDVMMDADMITPSGGSQPVDVRAPTLGLRYCMAVSGIFPPQP